MKDNYVLSIDQAGDVLTASIREDNLQGNIIETYTLPWQESFYPLAPSLSSDWTEEFALALKDIHGIEIERIFVKK